MLESTIDALPPKDELSITLAGAFLYGLYFFSFLQCICWQLCSEEGRHDVRFQIKARRWTLVLIVTIWILATVYVALGFVKSKSILHHIFNGIPFESHGVFPWYTTALCAIGNLTVLLVDTVVIYRCWVIYDKSMITIIFPVIMWVAGLTCTILQLYGETVPTGILGEHKWQPVNMKIGPGTVMAPFWASTILLNSYTMSLVMHRIWFAAKTSMGSGTAGMFQLALYALAESGFLYFTTTVAHFVVWWTPSGLAIRLANAMNIPAIGIAFNIIFIRAGQNRMQRSQYRWTDKFSIETLAFNNATVGSPESPVGITQ